MRHSGTATWIGLPVVLGSQNQSQTVSVSKPLDHKTDKGMLAAFWHSHWIGLTVVLGSQNQSQTVSVSKPLDHKTDKGIHATFWHSHLDRTSSCAGISEPITNSVCEQTSRSQD